jgi:hypothetical protein
MVVKTRVEELTNLEIIEDLEYYVVYAQYQSPSFVDKAFDIINKYLKELKERFEQDDN